jgi:hypothetical protein
VHVEVCDFPAPLSGTWYLRIVRFWGSGLYQVTATVFGSSRILREGFELGDTSAWSRSVP